MKGPTTPTGSERSPGGNGNFKSDQMPPDSRRSDSIVIIGMPGVSRPFSNQPPVKCAEKRSIFPNCAQVGKSTLAVIAATYLQRLLIDTDRALALRCGMNVNEYALLHGETRFRELGSEIFPSIINERSL